jgi:hypothetical protein
MIIFEGDYVEVNGNGTWHQVVNIVGDVDPRTMVGVTDIEINYFDEGYRVETRYPVSAVTAVLSESQMQERMNRVCPE